MMLEDDLTFFPPYTCSLVVTDKVLKENPELKNILAKLENTIDTKTMQKMNDASDSRLLEPALIARQFLESHHYFEEEQP